MLKSIVVVYDDLEKPNNEIRNISGNKSFGEIIFKRKTLRERMQEETEKNNGVISFFWLGAAYTPEGLRRELEAMPENTAVIHLYSRYGIKNSREYAITVQKAQYCRENYKVVCNDRNAMGIFSCKQEYLDYLAKGQNGNQSLSPHSLEGFTNMEGDFLVDLGNESQFLTFITGGFDARFFNSLRGDAYTVTKSSTNKKKIKAEHDYYYLLPDSMKMWYAMPFAYQEDGERASYTMERYHMSDIAIRFIHGAVSIEEFEDILDKLFYFISHRERKRISKEEYDKICYSLYIQKLEERIKLLKQNKKFTVFDTFIREGTDFKGIDEVIAFYKRLYEKIMPGRKHGYESVIGHGDLCFSNILYNKEASLLRLIDPKGAEKEEDLWTNPYYDIAKLSHSICGCYDFFNSGLYEIAIEDNLKFKVEIDTDNRQYRDIFRNYLETNGYSYTVIRLLEASLFLSMLPLHMDQEKKVFGFILNAITILKEVEECLKA